MKTSIKWNNTVTKGARRLASFEKAAKGSRTPVFLRIHMRDLYRNLKAYSLHVATILSIFPLSGGGSGYT